MWWAYKRIPKVQTTKVDWKLDQINKLIAFRNQGETFRYLGLKMLVTGHSDISATGRVIPELQCDYVDNNGVLRTCAFAFHELPTLEKESGS
jgi:hypothetical protein